MHESVGAHHFGSVRLARDVGAARGWRTKAQVLLRGPGWAPRG
jgi:hypothetical protein